MKPIEVKVKRLFENSQLPTYGTAGSCALDLFACINRPIKIMKDETVLVPTGIAVELPEGYGLFIIPRSGLAVKYDVVVHNTPGLVDTDYRGELKVVLKNYGESPFYVNPDARIGQLIVMPIPTVKWKEVDELSHTDRADNGFGSTGGI